MNVLVIIISLLVLGSLYGLMLMNLRQMKDNTHPHWENEKN